MSWSKSRSTSDSSQLELESYNGTGSNSESVNLQEKCALRVQNSNGSSHVEDDHAKSTFEETISRVMSNHSRNEKFIVTDDMAKSINEYTAKLKKHTTRDGDFDDSDEIFNTVTTNEDDETGFNAQRIIRDMVNNANEQGIHLRKSGVTLEEVCADGIDASALEGQTVGDILTLPYTIYKGIRNSKNKKIRKIIQNINVLAKPGEMVLVLGRPGAGCSSFLKTTAGEIDQFAGGVEGEIYYDGIPQSEMMKNYKADVIYNGELDVHFPYLTVQQTLDFAIACKTPAIRVDNLSRSDYIAFIRDLYATIFGLRHTYNTLVGNDFVRGVSGGERKRVSIAEALAARGTIYCWDNATRGLDASTALEYAEAIRIMTNIQQSTAFVTIYQASENIYNCFDKVTVLYLGKQIYFGKIRDAKDYFYRMGYECPSRQVTAEFLTALTDPKGYHVIRPGFESSVPRTSAEFEEYWRNSPEFAQLKQDIVDYNQSVNTDEIRQYYKSSMSQEKAKGARKKSYYTLSFPEQVKLCTIRGFQRIYGNKSYTVTNCVAALIQSFVTGSLYYNSPSTTNGAFSRSGVLYFALLYYCLMGLANISFEHRPILQKHKGYSLYHPAAEALASTLSAFPFRMISLTIFFIVLFFLSGLHRTASNFFICYLFLSMCSEAINGLFEMISAGCDDIAQANSIAGILMMALSMYSTYMIQLPKMHPWFKWIAYILPIQYSFESMLNAEFHGRHMDCGGTLVPAGPGYEDVASNEKVCAFAGSRPGQSWVNGDDYLKTQYRYQYKHTWRNFGIMWCFLLGYIGIKAIVTEIKRPVKSGGDALIFKKGFKPTETVEDIESNAVINISENKEKFTPAEEADDTNLEGLESTGIFIWRDVCYTIPYDGGMRRLLDNVSGYCRPGTMTALMGESGAGKTTLLNTLAQRNVGIITGDMLVNGQPIDASFERRAGYVQQQDLHVAEMTVRESLQFSARMRRNQDVPDEEKMAYVEKIIEVLGMEEYSEALVGAIGCGLNVEQRKKLSIGVELVAKPDLLLFLDEPTSGLDSQSSWAIVQLLKKLANAGQSILCTIHQPSATLFEQFDRLLLLKKGGQTVYFGDIGENSDILLKYFERNGARKCTSSENPAEYILEAIGAGATASVQEDWHEVWKNSHEFAENRIKIDHMLEELHNSPPETGTVSNSKYATSYFYQFRHVLWRNEVVFWRSMHYIFSKLMLHIVGGLFIGFTFFNVGTSYRGLQSSLFAAFMSIVQSAPAMNQIQARAIAQRDLFEVRESKSNTFHWSLIIITQYICEIPYHFVCSAIFFVSMYFPLRSFFEASRSAVYYLNYCIMFQLFYVSLGLMILYVAPNLPSANVIMGLLLSFMLGFCGVVQPASLMPTFWTFMWKASPYTYFVQNLMGIMLHKKPVICTKSELSYFEPPSGQTCGQYMEKFFQTNSGYIKNPNDTSNCAYCVYSVGDEYLSYVSSKYSYLWRNFGFFWAYIIFNFFAMVGLYYIIHVRKISLGNPSAILKRFKKN
ncbi:hypothetical protein TBLA_0G02820 [Henningerozyma blattae CBS 6284]|uniref:ABC transporter domain-containing protein n=1 Tax=Henningerozyma blattae (strain ATCC 34711 / CBS 6284 / DSM 70876 / NBRC 10599 / NRRL Y-10934 / UCD 77-7) TaxID=1071380 RepID=I2H767_HENB6|nr:hypothetical protein TBLA_0G02820 [Tetrapisispora blattae CBS 6284]CCH62219.1 hypothetical protein TBLA_0G02820 [Tetrapisispora blattae CBS 6284]